MVGWLYWTPSICPLDVVLGRECLLSVRSNRRSPASPRLHHCLCIEHFGQMVSSPDDLCFVKEIQMLLRPGPTWPVTGEIDIVEGVNDYTNNQATTHTDNGCTLPTSNSSALGITGSIVGGTNCAALETNNEGCGFLASQSNSFGAAFNSNGGGVHASELSTSSQRSHTFLMVVQCSGMTTASPYTSSRGMQYRQISQAEIPCQRVGDCRWPNGPQVRAIHHSSSKTKLSCSTPRSGILFLSLWPNAGV